MPLAYLNYGVVAPCIYAALRYFHPELKCTLHTQESHLTMVGIAAFMGLRCTPEQAFHVWRTHQNELPHGDYTAHNLDDEVVEWMNATMGKLLPEPLARRWGVVPTDL